MADLINFPVEIGAILEESARKSGRLLNAATSTQVSWNGTRAYVAGANLPSFLQTRGEKSGNTGKDVEDFDMNTIGLSPCFRISKELLKGAEENGTKDSLIATKFAEHLKKINQVVEYAIIHGYDLAKGKKITAYDNKNGSIQKALEFTGKDNIVITDGKINDAFVDASIALGEFDTTNFFALPKAFAELYKDTDARKVVMLDGNVNVMGVNVVKLPEIGAMGVNGAESYSLIAGDFSKVLWGVKALSDGLQVIEYGDPDGLGDLQAMREVAFKFDVAYAWGISHPEAFAGVKLSDGAEG